MEKKEILKWYAGNLIGQKSDDVIKELKDKNLTFKVVDSQKVIPYTFVNNYFHDRINLFINNGIVMNTTIE